MHAISSNNLTVYLYMVFMSWSDATNLVTRFVSLSEMAMEECCGHEELELYVNLGSEDINVKQCGIKVIVDLDSFEGMEWDHDIDNQESEVGRDRVPYHLLPHPLYGSLTFSTIEQFKDYLYRKSFLSTSRRNFQPELN